jgi:hypothetical protein
MEQAVSIILVIQKIVENESDGGMRLYSAKQSVLIVPVLDSLKPKYTKSGTCVLKQVTSEFASFYLSQYWATCC